VLLFGNLVEVGKALQLRASNMAASLWSKEAALQAAQSSGAGNTSARRAATQRTSSRSDLRQSTGPDLNRPTSGQRTTRGGAASAVKDHLSLPSSWLEQAQDVPPQQPPYVPQTVLPAITVTYPAPASGTHQRSQTAPSVPPTTTLADVNVKVRALPVAEADDAALPAGAVSIEPSKSFKTRSDQAAARFARLRKLTIDAENNAYRVDEDGDQANLVGNEGIGPLSQAPTRAVSSGKFSSTTGLHKKRAPFDEKIYRHQVGQPSCEADEYVRMCVTRLWVDGVCCAFSAPYLIC